MHLSLIKEWTVSGTVTVRDERRRQLLQLSIVLWSNTFGLSYCRIVLQGVTGMLYFVQ